MLPKVCLQNNTSMKSNLWLIWVRLQSLIIQTNDCQSYNIISVTMFFFLEVLQSTVNYPGLNCLKLIRGIHRGINGVILQAEHIPQYIPSMKIYAPITSIEIERYFHRLYANRLALPQQRTQGLDITLPPWLISQYLFLFFIF